MNDDMASPRATPGKDSPQNPRSAGASDPGFLPVSSSSLEVDLQAAGDVVRMREAEEDFASAHVPASSRYEPPVTALQEANTARLLPARYSDSVLTRLADTPQDLQALYELDNATNDRLIAEANGRLGITARELVAGIPYARIINAAFAHPHPQGARFSTPFRGAWYAGLELATAKAEVLFHRSIQLAEIAWQSREDLDYDHYQADFAGSFHDLRPQAVDVAGVRGNGDAVAGPVERARKNSFRAAAEPAQPEPWQRTACLDPDSYRFSQEVAVELLGIGSPGIVYPSARRAAGTCIACFRPGLVANVRKRDLHRLSWFPDRQPTFVKIPRTAL